MKIKSVALLTMVPLLFGCTSTTIKTYSADFKVYPIETKDVGKTITTPDGDTVTIAQQYQFECVLTRVTQTPEGDTLSTDFKSSFTSEIGYDAKVGTECDGNVNQFEGKLEDIGSEYQAHLKATVQMNGEEPITCAQTLSLKK